MYDRDVQSIRFVGNLAVAIGLVLFLLTTLGSLLGLLVTVTNNTGNIARGIMIAILGLMMSTALISCGSELQRLKFVGRTNLENLRLVWTAQFLAMLISMFAAAYLIPPLSVMSLLMLLMTWSIRGAVIRLTRRY